MINIEFPHYNYEVKVKITLECDDSSSGHQHYQSGRICVVS